MTSAVAENNTAVALRGIVKRFPGVTANDGANLEVRQGEIHALLGENGAGKTSLMNVLYGIYHPDEGEIWVRGHPVKIHSPHDAIRLGIGMIHQQFRLVQTHTVTENVILGLRESFFFPERAARRRILDLAEKYGLKVDPDARIWQLSAGEQQRVEILKALYRGVEILIMDEPTSMLTPGEALELLHILRRMTAEGLTVIFITHKLEEVMEVSDRVTVMRAGKSIATLETAQTNARELAQLMVGRDVLFRLEKKAASLGAEVLKVKQLHVMNDKGLPAVVNISFEVRAGEIFGIAGVSGNGQRELVEAIAGLRPVSGGQIWVNGENITQSSPRTRIERGIGFVPGERWMALIPGMSVADNMILKNYARPPIGHKIFLDQNAIASHADTLIREYAISTPSRQTPIKRLSGGNIQRALLAREMTEKPSLLIVAQPTSGLDVGATETIWNLLLEERARGAAILLISDDLKEALALSDRLAVLFEGQIMGQFQAENVDIEKIGLMMAGALRQPIAEYALGESA
ncbi:MAG: heme ABC transporter ATP-binding protein [Anaerolineae bacterium]|nr:MAG: heme ABC transporter ATP-binding protein [Anaerolineae bacterium]